jgi:hypothetical protein
MKRKVPKEQMSLFDVDSVGMTNHSTVHGVASVVASPGIVRALSSVPHHELVREQILRDMHTLRNPLPEGFMDGEREFFEDRIKKFQEYYNELTRKTET